MFDSESINTGKTKIIDLGPSEELKVESTLNDLSWNFIKVSRSDDPLFRWWGNLNSKAMNRLIYSYDEKPRKWKAKLFYIAQNQYEKYGDYYRLLDNSFGDPFADDIYETLK
jgi:hypothetical protein